MSTVRTLLSLKPSEYILALRAAVLVSFLTIAVRVFPFPTICRLLRSQLAEEPSMYSVQQICWAVEAIARRTPGATCLVRSLAAERMLKRERFPAEMRIGVTREQEKFRAHAWVELHGRVVIGRVHDLDSFHPLEVVNSSSVEAASWLKSMR